MKQFANVAILIPARNEESVIGSTLKSILKIHSNDDVYVVDDGSSDNTKSISGIFTKNVATSNGLGKAEALNFAIKHFRLIENYNYILFMDADTYPDPEFIERAIIHFYSDINKDIVCVVGRVKGNSNNWISKYRQWEYLVSHMIHKKAQSITKSIIVVPGCATMYRSEIFKKIVFPTGTLTEDMDFTFLMHRSGYGNMMFEEKSVVYTQDPAVLRDYIKQLYRWYTGFWQCVRKHNIPWLGQTLDLEVAMLASEGLYNGLLTLLLMFSIIPLTAANSLSVFYIPLAIDFSLFFIPTIIWSAISDRDYLRMVYIPQFYFLRFLSCVIFFISFFKGYLSFEKTYIWSTSRRVFHNFNTNIG